MDHILVIDDEPDIVRLISYNLGKEGFKTSSASDGEEALQMVRREQFSLILLDLMLPGISGLEVCRIMRRDPRTAGIPIIMVTAKGQEPDKVHGLESGADDYITKPFSPKELIARVKAVLRRVAPGTMQEQVLRLGDLVIQKETYTVTKKGKPLDLSATEFRLLLYLAERKGRVFSRDQLLDAIWKGEAFVEPRTVDVHIRRLRMEIEDDPSSPLYIKTRRGLGYFVDGESS